MGGSSSIAACGAARLGLRTAFVGVVGDDLFGRFTLETLRASGVDVDGVAVDPATPTGLSVVLTDGEDRATLTAQGTIGGVTPDMLTPELLERTRHVHTAGFYVQGIDATIVSEVIRRARAAGATTSLDPGFDPSGEWDGGLKALLPEIDVLMPNAVEVCGLAGTESVEGAALELARLGPDVLVKCGAEGVLAVSGTEVVGAPALAVDVVDTIGAGDSTNAGWLAGRLNGWPIERAARLAAVCGSLSTLGRGGTASQPTLAEAEALL
jgi:sugar/nucleoside kinase (ribokinase family)